MCDLDGLKDTGAIMTSDTTSIILGKTSARWFL